MNHKNNAKYAFYYLLSLVALIFVGLAVGMAVFGIIDRSVADVLDSAYNSYDSQLKFAISAILVAAPIYYWMAALIARGLKKGSLDKDSGIRRWLTYFIILVSALIILGFLLGVLNSFLSGELTARFILKSLSVFLIAGTVFSYYLYDIKREKVGSRDLVSRIFMLASLALVIAAFVAACFFVESPKQARARRLDGIVVSRMYSLENVVNSYYERHGNLPESLVVLMSESEYRLALDAAVDPETKEEISYEVVGADSYRLCATFRTDSLADQTRPVSYNDHSHGSGYQCITSQVWNSGNTTKAVPVYD
jgi:hypothetical protein